MTAGPTTLLITEDWIGREIASRLNKGTCARCEDLYKALARVADRPWSAVVLTRPQEDLAGFCRAMHRLRADAPIYVWCSAEGESQLRPLLGREVQETFLYPPTPAQIQRCVRAIAQSMRRAAVPLTSTSPAEVSAPEPPQEAETVPQPAPVPSAPPARFTPPPAAPEAAADLSSVELMALVRATRSAASLEQAIQQVLRRRARLETTWQDDSGEGQALLTIDGDPTRVLTLAPPDQQLDAAAERLIESLHLCLSGLVATARRSEWLRRLAITDELTSLYNRRYFYVRTDRILRRMHQQGRQATLVLFDVDNFKHYNDRFGHAAGDEILRETAVMMRQALRENDVIARIGGDEFAVLLWEAEPPRQADSERLRSALALVKRFTRAIRHHTFAVLGEEARGSLSMSGGAAVFPRDGESCRELLRSADRGLRRAKESRKDHIQLVGDLPGRLPLG